MKFKSIILIILSIIFCSTIYTQGKNDGLFVFNVKYSQDDLKILFKKINGAYPTNPYEGLLNLTYQLKIFVKNLSENKNFEIEVKNPNKPILISDIVSGKYTIYNLKIIVYAIGKVSVVDVNQEVTSIDINITSELPQFSIDSNTINLYGQIDLSGGNINYIKNETIINDLKKFVEKNKNLKDFIINENKNE